MRVDIRVDTYVPDKALLKLIYGNNGPIKGSGYISQGTFEQV